MLKIINNRRGITMLELMVYLGITVIIVSGLTTFLVQVTKQRINLHNQQLAQHNNRQVIEKMTHVLRNAYDVEIYQNGTALDVYSHNYTDHNSPIITTITYQEKRLFYGVSTGTRSVGELLLPLTDFGIVVEQVSFEQISSALQIALTMAKSESTASINSTISFRQQ